MCGRYTLHAQLNLLLQQFAAEVDSEFVWDPRYNIAPTQQVPVIRFDSEQSARRMELRRWGLIPSWAKDPKIGSRMLNARGETVATKPSFRSAFKRRRCLVPANGYYEWKKTEDGKQPFYIQRDDQQPFAMAGLWESNRSGTESYETYTIITTQSNRATESLHDRMPVILEPRDFDTWLNPEIQEHEALLALIQPYEESPMRLTAVSRQVNNVRNEGPELLSGV